MMYEAPCESPKDSGGIRISSFALNNASIFTSTQIILSGCSSTLGNCYLPDSLFCSCDLIVYIIDLPFQIELVESGRIFGFTFCNNVQSSSQLSRQFGFNSSSFDANLLLIVPIEGSFCKS